MKHLLSLLVLFSVNASANVVASPSYYDFGNVKSGTTQMMTVWFTNYSNQPIPFFYTYCTGDMSVYSCFSNCGYLTAMGSCVVRVQFSPQSGDGMRKNVWVQGQGGIDFATSTVYGTDSK